MIPRPKYGVTSIDAALEFHWQGYHISEKMDGCWHELSIGESVIVGEMMPDGRFFAFDIPIYQGQDIRKKKTSERLNILDGFNLLRPATPETGETPAQFIKRIIDAGGEGIVAKALDCPFGAKTFKVKRVETHDCNVVERHATKRSVRLELDGEDVGWCKVGSRVHIGDIIEVKCMKRTASGKLREPIFIRSRPDKLSLRHS